MASSAQDLSHLAHRKLIGFLGLLLPFALLGLAAFRPTEGLDRWEILDSVSAYYYTGAVAAFLGILFALALFLFTYGGYEGYRIDRIIGTIGGTCALGVALFPTGAPGGLVPPSWWTPATRTIHYLSATGLFLTFILFSLWLFRKSKAPPGGELSPGKRRRNRVYLLCGLTMVAAVGWAGSSWFTGVPIFWAECVALWAFAISWLVKGYAHAALVDTVKSMLDR